MIFQNTSKNEEASANLIYSEEQLKKIDINNVPSHMAFIMDGNRRWAENHGLPTSAGHWEGACVLTKIVRAASELGVKVLTVYAFSTENWSRSSKEIEELMHIFEVYLHEQRERLIREGIKLDAIGDLSKCPVHVQKAFNETKEATRDCKKIELILALNYGGRDEIRRAISKILEDFEKKKISKQDITEDLLSMYLDTAKWRDPELLVRTSGEQRLSNFMLWQLSYTEVVIMDALWPDFSEDHLLEVIEKYQKRQRRLGG
jgi:undecaprenyl diphosphate synthase